MTRAQTAAGFSILEVLLATSVFVVGVLALAQALAAATVAQGRAAEVTAATMAAAQKLEELRAAPWDALAGGRDRRGAVARVWTVTPLDGAAAVIITVEAVPGGVRLATVRARVMP